MINWPVPSYVGEIYTSPLGASWVWNGYGWDTLGGSSEGGDLLYAEVQPDYLDIRALPGQSFQLLPSPGVGKYLDIVQIICESNSEVSPATSYYDYSVYKGLYFSYATSNYAADSNYIGSVGLSEGCLWMGDSNSFAIVVPYGNGPSAQIFDLDKGLYVGIDNANVPAYNSTVGNHLVTFKIFYRIKELSI